MGELRRGGFQERHQAWSELQEVVVFSVPLNVRFRGVTSREGVLLRGPGGWGECAPFWDYDAQVSARWLASALSLAVEKQPEPNRDLIPVNVTIPVVDNDEVLRRLRAAPGCATAKIKVADAAGSDETQAKADRDRVRLVSEYLAEHYGEAAKVRVDANCAWTVKQAARSLADLDRAAAAVGGLQYAEQPVPTVQDLAALRKATAVPLAADESIRLSSDPLAVRDLHAADVAVLKVAPLGGVKKALNLGRALGMNLAVSSALDTSIGLAAGVALAAALPGLRLACGLGTARLLAADVVDTPLVPATGFGPGNSGLAGTIGITEADDVRKGPLAKNSLPLEESTAARWISRLVQMSHFVDEDVH